MAKVDCPREQDALDALTTGRWPGRCDAELRSHIERCAVCADLVEVAAPLLETREAAWRDARVPSSGLVWWRAQMRARQEAARQAARPITLAQAIAAIVAVALGAMLLGAIWPWLRPAVGDLSPTALNSEDLAAMLAGQGWLGPAIMMVAGLVVAPLVIYFALADD